MATTRILLVHSGGQWIRGSEQVLIDHIQHIDRALYDPVVWTNCLPLARFLTELSVDTEVDRFSVLFDRRRPAFDFSNYVKLVGKGLRLLRDHKVSLVHCNSSETCQWMVPAARRFRVPVLAELHLDSKLLSRCVRLVHQTAHITGVSRDLIAPYLSDGVPPDRLSVAHPDLNGTRLDSMSLTSRSSFGLFPSDLVILGVGSLLPHKGFDILVRAVAGLQATDRRVVLMIAGDGEERQALERLSASCGLVGRGVFLGSVSNAPALMRDVADLVVVPSRRESFGLVLIEAGYFGKPCIAAAVGGTRDIIHPEDTGLLVPPDDVAALTGALQRLVDAPAFAATLGSNLRKRVLAEFLAPSHSRQIEKLYYMLLQQRPRSLDADFPHWYAAYGQLAWRALSSIRARFR